MLTPSLPLSRPLGPPVCLARFPAARLWLKDDPPSPRLQRDRKPRRQRQPSWIDPNGINPGCPASLDTLKVSVPSAVKLAAAERARPAPDPDIIAAEWSVNS